MSAHVSGDLAFELVDAASELADATHELGADTHARGLLQRSQPPHAGDPDRRRATEPKEVSHDGRQPALESARRRVCPMKCVWSW